MKRSIYVFSLFILMSLLFVCCTDKNAYKGPDLSQKVEIDSAVVTGKLSNGISYYIRENHKPEKRAFFRLVVKAGSLQEDDDQLGLAHFTEHMLFDGTKHFPKHDMIDYFELIGMKWGPEVNAYTTFDHTAYMLEIPTGDKKILEKTMLVLTDWVNKANFDDQAVQKERGIITEEWRQSNDFMERTQKKIYNLVMNNPRYDARDVIGDTAIIRSCPKEAIKRFYKDWYRPDLISVIAVGDFDAGEIESMIKQYFEPISPAVNKRDPKEYKVVENNQMALKVIREKELPIILADLHIKEGYHDLKTLGDLKKGIIMNIIDKMIYERLDILANVGDSPYTNCYSYMDDYFPDYFSQDIALIIKDDNLTEGLMTLAREYQRIKKHGFNESELKKAKKEYLSDIEQKLKETDKTNSLYFIDRMMTSSIYGYPLIGYTFELSSSQKIIPSITIDEINNEVKNIFNEKDMVFTLSLNPEKVKLCPDEKQIKSIFVKEGAKDLAKWEDPEITGPLFDKKLTPGKIVKEGKSDAIKGGEYTLSNGVKVFYKPTDFKDNQIVFIAFSPGGFSISDDDNYFSAYYSDMIITKSGLGNFSHIQLFSYLRDKQVWCEPYIYDNEEGFRGVSTPKDLETAMQLIYLYCTAPRKDTEAFNRYIDKLDYEARNKNLTPEYVYRDSIDAVVHDYNLRKLPLTPEIVKKIDLEKAYEFYKDRFGDAGDFTFVFAGNFNADTLKKLSRLYLANLPSNGRKESWIDRNINFAKGMRDSYARSGHDKKSRVYMTFTGPVDYNNRELIRISLLEEILDNLLTENIREKKSGTYGTMVYTSTSQFPKPTFQFVVEFGCDPSRVEELCKSVRNVIASVQKKPVDEKYLLKAKEIKIKDNEVNRKNNWFWVSQISNKLFNHISLEEINSYDEMINNVDRDQIMNTAKKYIDMNNMIRVVLYPEDEKNT